MTTGLSERTQRSTTGSERYGQLFGQSELFGHQLGPSETGSRAVQYIPMQCRFTIERPVGQSTKWLPEVLSNGWTGEYDVVSTLTSGVDDQTDAFMTGLINYFIYEMKPYVRRPTYIRLSDDLKRDNYILTMPPSGRCVVLNVAVPATLAIDAATAKSTVDAPTELAEIVADVREKIGLPVADVAKMFGVGRRQFYNLLHGSSKSATDETRIRRLHSYVSTIYELLGHDPARVRSALLMPIRKDDYHSFFDVAALGDEYKTHAAFEDLQGAIHIGAPLHPRVPPSLRASSEVAERSLRAIRERARLGTDDDDD